MHKSGIFFKQMEMTTLQTNSLCLKIALKGTFIEEFNKSDLDLIFFNPPWAPLAFHHHLKVWILMNSHNRCSASPNSLNRCELTPPVFKELASLLKVGTLKSLSVGVNDVGDKGAKYLWEAVAHPNCLLEELEWVDRKSICYYLLLSSNTHFLSVAVLKWPVWRTPASRTCVLL